MGKVITIDEATFECGFVMTGLCRVGFCFWAKWSCSGAIGFPDGFPDGMESDTIRFVRIFARRGGTRPVRRRPELQRLRNKRAASACH